MQEVVPAVLERLLSEGRILCPISREPLSKDGDVLRSGAASWRIKNRSLDLYGQYGDDTPEFDDYAFARQVATSLGFSDTLIPEVTSAVADTALVAADSAYTAEIAELADRLGIEREETLTTYYAPLDNVAADLSFVSAHIGATMPISTDLTRSVRIRNEGSASFNSLGETPVHLSYHWLTS